MNNEHIHSEYHGTHPEIPLRSPAQIAIYHPCWICLLDCMTSLPLSAERICARVTVLLSWKTALREHYSLLMRMRMRFQLKEIVLSSLFGRGVQCRWRWRIVYVDAYILLLEKYGPAMSYSATINYARVPVGWCGRLMVLCAAWWLNVKTASTLRCAVHKYVYTSTYVLPSIWWSLVVVSWIVGITNNGDKRATVHSIIISSSSKYTSFLGAPL